MYFVQDGELAHLAQFSNEEISDFLEHFGVKGMRWGVRKSEGGSGERGKARRGLSKAAAALSVGEKVISEGEKDLIFLPQARRNTAAAKTQARLLGHATTLNRNSEFKGKDLKKDPELRDKYMSKLETVAKKIYAEELGIARTQAWGDFLGVNTTRATNTMRINAARDRLRHSDEDDRETLLELQLIANELGHVVNIKVPAPYLAQSDDDELYLVHYGTKGMKWGVRKDKGHEGERVKTKKLEKLDKKWEAEMDRTAYIKLHNAAAEKMNNGGIDKINNKPEYKDVDFNDPKNSAIADKYYAEHHKAFENAMIEAGPSLGMNPSGTKKFAIQKNAEGEDDVFLVPVEKDEVKHAEGDVSSRIRLKTNSKGVVLKYSVEEVELKHYGVKGMKWGVRKDRSSDSDDGPVSEDHARAVAALTKANSHGLSSLSTKEMRELTSRLEVEKKFNQLSSERARATRSTGRKVIDALFGDVGQVVTQEASNFAKKAARDAIRKQTEGNAKASKPKQVKNLDELLTPYSNRR